MCATLDVADWSYMDPEQTLNDLESDLKTDLQYVYQRLGLILERFQAYEGWRRKGGFASARDQRDLDFRYQTLRTRAYQMLQQTRDHYESRVTSPGKFQGESPWTPYLWDVAMMDGAHDPGDCEEGEHCVTIGEEDQLLWPNLILGARYYLFEQDDGFVVERHVYFPE